MLRKLRVHLTYANVMVTALLFVVLGGAAYAAFHLPKNSVKSKHIVDGQVKPVDQGAVPSAKVSHSVSQTIPDGINTPLAFDTEVYDHGGLHSGTNPSRLTAPKSGIYVISANVGWADFDVDGARTVLIRRNGADPNLAVETTVPSAGGRNRYQVVTTQAPLEAGDYVEVLVQQNSGSSTNTVFANSVNGAPHFEMTWVAPPP